VLGVVVDQHATRRDIAFSDRNALDVDAKAVGADACPLRAARDRRRLDAEIVENARANSVDPLAENRGWYCRRKRASKVDDDRRSVVEQQAIVHVEIACIGHRR
jgi:hypothetical protein